MSLLQQLASREDLSSEQRDLVSAVTVRSEEMEQQV